MSGLIDLCGVAPVVGHDVASGVLVLPVAPPLAASGSRVSRPGRAVRRVGPTRQRIGGSCVLAERIRSSTRACSTSGSDELGLIGDADAQDLAGVDQVFAAPKVEALLADAQIARDLARHHVRTRRDQDLRRGCGYPP